jgi:hypothetical protein
MSEETKYELPRFQKALKAHSKILSAGTYWRYMNGLIPAFGQLIVDDPELAEALAADAQDLAQRRIVAHQDAA